MQASDRASGVQCLIASVHPSILSVLLAGPDCETLLLPACRIVEPGKERNPEDPPIMSCELAKSVGGPHMMLSCGQQLLLFCRSQALG